MLNVVGAPPAIPPDLAVPGAPPAIERIGCQGAPPEGRIIEHSNKS